MHIFRKTVGLVNVADKYLFFPIFSHLCHFLYDKVVCISASSYKCDLSCRKSQQTRWYPCPLFWRQFENKTKSHFILTLLKMRKDKFFLLRKNCWNYSKIFNLRQRTIEKNVVGWGIQAVLINQIKPVYNDRQSQQKLLL